MNNQNLTEARELARDFIRLIDGADSESLLDDFYFYTGCKQSAAIKRKSMDLTRALAEMRKSN